MAGFEAGRGRGELQVSSGDGQMAALIREVLGSGAGTVALFMPNDNYPPKEVIAGQATPEPMPAPAPEAVVAPVQPHIASSEQPRAQSVPPASSEQPRIQRTSATEKLPMQREHGAIEGQEESGRDDYLSMFNQFLEEARSSSDTQNPTPETNTPASTSEESKRGKKVRKSNASKDKPGASNNRLKEAREFVRNHGTKLGPTCLLLLAVAVGVGANKVTRPDEEGAKAELVKVGNISPVEAAVVEVTGQGDYALLAGKEGDGKKERIDSKDGITFEGNKIANLISVGVPEDAVEVKKGFSIPMLMKGKTEVVVDRSLADLTIKSKSELNGSNLDCNDNENDRKPNSFCLTVPAANIEGVPQMQPQIDADVLNVPASDVVYKGLNQVDEEKKLKNKLQEELDKSLRDKIYEAAKVNNDDVEVESLKVVFDGDYVGLGSIYEGSGYKKPEDVDWLEPDKVGVSANVAPVEGNSSDKEEGDD